MKDKQPALLSKIKKALSEGGVWLLYGRMMWKLGSVFVGPSAAHLFIHPLDRRYPTTKIHVDEFEPTPGDVRITERIMAAFARATADEPRHQDEIHDLWNIIRHEHYGDFFEVYATGDPRKVAEYLVNMHQHSLTYGISDFNSKEYAAAYKRFRQENLALIKDKMVALGEAVGVLNVEDIRKNLYTDPDELVEDIARVMGIDILPPEIDGGLVKVQFGKGYFSSRDIYSLYTAWRMRQLLGDSRKAVCEIGAGMGKVALYAHRFGLVDYTVFDLPLTNVAQAWYLIKSGLPVTLYGENERTRNAIRILPYWELDTNKRYGLTLNADSFPEISEVIVREYLEKIRTNTTRYFLSINQERCESYGRDPNEHHLAVQRIVESVGGYERIYRFSFWLRKGYVEELYAITSTTPPEHLAGHSEKHRMT